MARDRKASARWSPGSPVAGTPFRALRLLGSSGMSSVYAVEHAASGERFALKVLSGRLQGRPDCVARFELEARALESLGGHPNLVALRGTGRLPDGRPFLVMNLLEGETLRQALRRGPLPVRYACSFVQQLLSALWAVHGAGVVHRDVKPDTLFVSPDGRCTLLDFGVIKVQPGAGALASYLVAEPGSLVGTAHYLAPEQAQGRAPDARADLYAAGVVLAECLTGCPPLGDLSPGECVRHVAEHGFPSLDEVGALHVPPALRRVVRKATMLDPNERYANAESFASALTWVALELGLNVPGVQSGPWCASASHASPAADPALTSSTTLDANPPSSVEEAPSSPKAAVGERHEACLAPADAQTEASPASADARTEAPLAPTDARTEAHPHASAGSKPKSRRPAHVAPWPRPPAPGGRFGRKGPRATPEGPGRQEGVTAGQQRATEATTDKLLLGAKPASNDAAPPSCRGEPQGTKKRFADLTYPRAVGAASRFESGDANAPASLERDGVTSPSPRMGPPASDSTTRISRLAAWGTLLFAMAIFATPRWRPHLVDALVTVASPSLPEGWDTSLEPKPREPHASAQGLRSASWQGGADDAPSETSPATADAPPSDDAAPPAAPPAPAKPSPRADDGRGAPAPGRPGASKPHPFRAGLKPNYLSP
ncbi:MAG TPA: protein kinase, partial [Polyangiaceae bacterium]|nr:protein kinase [Polyangiaceae bacterium]